MGRLASRSVAAWLRAGTAVVTAGFGVATVALLLDRESRVTSYFVTSQVALLAGLAAGLGLLVAGTAAHLSGHTPLDRLASLAGVAWLAPLWAAWETGPPLVRSVAVLLPPLLVALLVHLAMLRGPTGGARRMVPAAYTLVGLLVLGRALVHDPLRDPDCWVSCGQDANVLLLSTHMELAHVLDVTLLWVTVALASVALLTTARQVAAGLNARPAVLAVTVAAMLALTGEAAYAAVRLTDTTARFDHETGMALFFFRSAVLLSMAVGASWLAADRSGARVRMARLARELGDAPEPGDLEAHLARSLHDHSLEVHYWSRETGRYVDRAGRAVDVRPDDARAATWVVRGGEPVAVVRHDRDQAAGTSLADELGSASRLVLDNERLRAELMAQAEELRRSRARIVTAGDELRRGLERDLHDGAQQRLLAATFELRLARADAEQARAEPAAGELDAAVERAAAVLGELRDFAHGVFPAILDEAGLTEAVESMVDTAASPVDLECRLEGVPSAEVGRAAYLVAKAAVESPTAAGATRLRVTRQGPNLVVEAHGIGRVDEVHLGDRVGAVGGRLETGAGWMRAVIP